MKIVPEELKYTKEHEWVRIEGSRAIIGITDTAQSLLGDVVFVELPEVGSEYAAHDSLGTIESVKAVSDIFSPVSGKVLEVNSELETSPDLINKAPYEGGWIVVLEISEPGDVDNLLNNTEYGKLLLEGE